MRTPLLLIAVLGASAALAACTNDVKAPYDTGVCFVVEQPPEGEKGELKFNRLADNQPQIETCAARLEEMRLRFLSMGGNRREVVGSYQGQFIFIDRAGVWQSQSLHGNRFFSLARTGDGRLAVPGAIQHVPATPETAPTVEMAPPAK
ncbi:hypothetical protein BH09PSE1_BH09PSE1_25320 [soil metagenome]